MCLAKAQWSPPPTELQLARPAQAEFVICDYTIEVVFRWLKHILQLDHFISRDPQGIMRRVLTALIVYGLPVLFNQDSGCFSPKQLWRQLQANLHQAIFDWAYQLGLEHGRQQVNLQIT